MTCTCIVDVAKQIKDINGFQDVRVEVGNFTGEKRPFTNFFTIEHVGDKVEQLPMPCKFCPFCGVKFK